MCIGVWWGVVRVVSVVGLSWVGGPGLRTMVDVWVAVGGGLLCGWRWWVVGRGWGVTGFHLRRQRLYNKIFSIYTYIYICIYVYRNHITRLA